MSWSPASIASRPYARWAWRRSRPSSSTPACTERSFPWDIADRVDFEAAIARRASGLHAGARRQLVGRREITAIDLVEDLLLALVLEPHGDLQQAIHVGAG